MICSNCGYEIKEGQRFCTNCGAAADAAAGRAADVQVNSDTTTATVAGAADDANMTEGAVNTEAAHSAETMQTGGMTQTDDTTRTSCNMQCGGDAAYSTEKSAAAIVASLPREYKPLSIWQFFGFEVLFGIPIIGVIASLIFALDASKNVSLTNFARARFLWSVLKTILMMFIVMLAVLNYLH